MLIIIRIGPPSNPAPPAAVSRRTCRGSWQAQRMPILGLIRVIIRLRKPEHLWYKSIDSKVAGESGFLASI